MPQPFYRHLLDFRKSNQFPFIAHLQLSRWNVNIAKLATVRHGELGDLHVRLARILLTMTGRFLSLLWPQHMGFCLVEAEGRQDSAVLPKQGRTAEPPRYIQAVGTSGQVASAHVPWTNAAISRTRFLDSVRSRTLRATKSEP